ncbi:biotin--[acetyl-CoA-carboxylase] ligase [Sphingomonas oryzagri]|uniref:biotin--[biotin carboxyl-carrier protein] ligase n=1 Tax=Sphingomonas oryzagri TaxID=3042314 RepID=A0ABT6MZX2_9SPHN|nr:biotin--[acetyl-CoA-carboxylase] ligase [Sphingomonas oryzagri]MDH7638610.1 biotin--[acetyl-CoA-carboxylase] ligase [Sphingomonas oryzagri]
MDIRTIRDTLSTNDEVLALAQAGAPEGVWVRAEQQRGGRGRQGRAWVSPPGNLYASVLVRLQPHDPPAPSLALVAAVAVTETAEAFGAAPQIKWPNDLLVDGAKLSGILLERAGDAVVVGIGVNLAHHPEDIDRPATSLATILGHAPEPDAFVGALAESFARWLYRWRAEGLAPVRSRWLEKAHPIGTALSARLPDGASLDGLFDGLDAMGALRLRLADGEVHVIHAADVFLIRD